MKQELKKASAIKNSKTAPRHAEALKGKSNGNGRPEISEKGRFEDRKKKADSKNGEPGTEQSPLMKLFEDSLKDMYWAEKALSKALPKVIKKVTSPELSGAIENHLSETEGHVEKIEQVFEIIGVPPKAKKCEAMEGLIKESEEIIADSDAGAMRDAGIIAAAQKVEHYEIATYGTLNAFAEVLGLDDAASVLKEILDEEKAADAKLTEIAAQVNREAAAGEEREEQEEDEDEDEGREDEDKDEEES